MPTRLSFLAVACLTTSLLGTTTLLGSAAAQNADTWDLYLERCAGGCNVSPGVNNARNYQTDLLQTAGPTTLSEFSRGDAVWDQVVECVRQVYEPFNVNVTDVLPPASSSNFHMAIVAGTAAEAGLPAGVGGVGFVRCDALTNQISLTFDVFGSNVNQICATIAQESAHTFGLGHAFHCSDPMTYLPLCGRAFFRDENFQCGEFQAGSPQCRCSGTAQNSHDWLIGKLGASTNPISDASVEIQNLTADQMVEDGFRVTVLADHYRGIGRVEFWTNGTLQHTEEGPGPGETRNPWLWISPDSHADGYIDIEVKAYTDIDSVTVEALTVLKGAPCTDASMCNDLQFCEDGRCKTPIAEGELGEACEIVTDCKSGFCADNGGEKLCSQTCDPNSLLDDCGDGFECLAGGGSGICWPEGGGGCGCTAGGDEGAPIGGLLLLIGIAIAFRKRSSKR